MSTNIVARLALAAVVCGIACDADEVTVETEQVAEPAEGDGESHVGEEEFRVSWSCFLQAEEEEEEEEEVGKRDIYCLAKCRGYQWTRAIWSPVDVSERTDLWCQRRATRFCDDVGREYQDWCWGGRE